MKRYFVNLKALKKYRVKLSRNGNKVQAKINGQGINWQVIG